MDVSNSETLQIAKLFCDTYDRKDLFHGSWCNLKILTLLVGRKKEGGWSENGGKVEDVDFPSLRDAMDMARGIKKGEPLFFYLLVNLDGCMSNTVITEN